MKHDYIFFNLDLNYSFRFAKHVTFFCKTLVFFWLQITEYLKYLGIIKKELYKILCNLIGGKLVIYIYFFFHSMTYKQRSLFIITNTMDGASGRFADSYG